MRKLDRKITSPLFISDHIWILMIILLAAALRLFHLGGQSLWRTEAWNYVYASVPFTNSLKMLVADNVSPSPDLLILRLYLTMGKSEIIVRFPSVILGILSVAAIYRLGRLVKNHRLGLLSALLLTLNPFHLWYSQEARMYAMVIFFTLGSTYFFLRAVEEDTWKLWAGLVFSSMLAYCTHYFALQLALVQFVFILCRFRMMHRVFRKWVICQVLAFLPLIPWLIAYFSQDVVYLGVGWISRPDLLAPLQTLWTFSSNDEGSLTTAAIIGLLPFSFVLLRGLLSSEPVHHDHKLFLALWLWIPIVATWLVSQRRPIYLHRYLSITLPAYLILLAYGITSISNRIVKWGLTFVLMAMMISSVVKIYFDPAFFKEDWRGVLTYIESRSEANDLIVLRRSEIVAPVVYYGQDNQLFVVLDREAGPNPLQRLVSEYPRLWLICRDSCAPSASEDWTASPVYSDRDLQTGEWLNAHRDRVVEEKEFFGIHVLLVQGSS